MRANWGIPLLDPDSVVIVTDSATCRKAAEAFAREDSLSDSSFRVVVLRIRQLRVVVPEPPPDEDPYLLTFSPGSIFDSTFTTLIERRWL